MSREFTVIIEKDEDGYFVGSVAELKGCHTQAKSLDQLIERIREATLAYLGVEGDARREDLQFIGIQKIAV